MSGFSRPSIVELRVPPGREERFSPAYALEPLGRESGHTEALSSYLIRLSAAHSMTPGVFIEHALLARTGRDTITHELKSLYLINGPGKYGQKFVELLERATRTDDLHELTFRGLANVIDRRAHGLLSRQRRWCPLCWKESLEDGREPYTPLAWLCKLSEICVEHDVRLVENCPHCNATQQVIAKFPDQACCQSCGASLWCCPRRRRPERPVSEKERWVSRAVTKLIEDFIIHAENYHDGAAMDAITRLVRAEYGGKPYTIGRTIDFPNDIVAVWARGEHRPAFAPLMEFCYRLDIPPDRLFSRDGTFSQPAKRRIGSAPRFVVRKTVPPDERERIRRGLDRYLASAAEDSLSLSALAKQLGATYSYISYHFPKQSKAVKSRYGASRKRKAAELVRDRMHRTKVAFDRLVAEGIYPSDRALMRDGRLTSAILGTPHVARALRKWRTALRSRN